MENSSPNPPKKRYETPQLSEFGDVAVLTQSAGNMGNIDGGIAPNSKTGI